MNRSIKQANGLFLSIILLYLGMVVLLSYLASYGIYAGKVFSSMVGEALIGVPAVLLLIWNRKNWRTWIPIKKIKLSTILLSILFAYLIMPLAALANAVSLIFVKNIAVEAMRAMMDIPAALLIFIVGFYGPACEELAFRGVIFGRYKRTEKILAAALLSALLFGLMHLNGNQLGYAAILGFIFALSMEASGSIWTAFIAHAVVNTHNVIMLLMSDRLLGLAGGQTMIEDLTYTPAELTLTIGILLPIAGFSCILAAGVLILIARNEGRLEYFKYIFSKKAKPQSQLQTEELSAEKPHFITWTLIVAVAICILIIFVLPFIRIR
ncbi:MAG: type II CAAX endopeptidase family protein [bacterium]|nr:type II CAAX endopeptidase family protein [bacterium]